MFRQLLCLTMISTAAMAASAVPASAGFEKLPVPDWVNTRMRATFHGLDPWSEESIKKAVEDGINVSFNGPGPYNCYWDGKTFVDPDGKPLDPEPAIKKIEIAHKYGIKVIGIMWHMGERGILNEHPDWQAISKPDGKPVDATKEQTVYGEWYSPFGDWYIRKNLALVKLYGWDGQNIDGFGLRVLSFNPYVIEGYRKYSGGADVPTVADPHDPAFRRYYKWRLDEWNKYVQKWQKALRAYKPDFAFIPWSTGPGRWFQWTFAETEGTELGNLLVDAPVIELFWDFPPDQSSNLLPSFVCRYYRAITKENPVYMNPYFRSQGQQHAVTPKVESSFRMLTILTNGMSPALFVWPIDPDTPQKYYFDLIKQREQYLIGSRSMKWAAVLVSENSRLFYTRPPKSDARGDAVQQAGQVQGSGVDSVLDQSDVPYSQRRIPRHMESAVGAFRALSEAHVPVDIICDSDIESGDRLKQYRVLFIPDAACLSEAAMARIREFAAAGGGVVATHQTSLLDSDGARRKDFGLADLFHVSYEAEEDHSAQWPNYGYTAQVGLAKHEITEDPVVRGNIERFSWDGSREDFERQKVDYIGWTTVVKPDASAQVVGDYRCYKDYLIHDQTARPLIALSEHGKGRVAYFAAAIDQAYFVSPYQYERALMVNAAKWVARDAAPQVEVKAPMCVQTTFYEQENGKRTIVHLLNEINTTADRALPDGNPPLREEIVPIADIEVTFNDPSVKRVHLEPEGTELEMRKSDGRVQVKVPVLKQHSMVVAER